MNEIATRADEVDVAERADDVRAASMRTILCLDWWCEDFGLRAASELRDEEGTEVLCPHRRPRCPLP